MLLMNGNKPILEFDLEDMYIHVLNNDFLPFALKDYIQTTDPSDFKKSVRDIETLRDFFSGRMLNISRENAKILLNVLSLPQTLKTEERVKISLMCRSLSMTDNFWTRENNETNLTFDQVCLRKNKLSDASYQISVLGRHISACLDDLKSDLLTNGMFAKTWRRTNTLVELWKTDKTIENINARSEVQVSKILDTTNIPHVTYRAEVQDGKYFAISQCFTNDNVSFVTAQDVRDYCDHIGTSFDKYVFHHFTTEMANMTVLDYIVANTDRHFENWGFLVDNNTNKITSFAPLFDHNQALIADIFETDIDDLVYEPTGKSFLDSAKEALQYCNLTIDTDILPEQCKARYYNLFPLKELETDIEYTE